MRISAGKPRFLKTSLWLTILLFAPAAVSSALAQENTSSDSTIPLVYSAENTGAKSPAPNFPDFAQLPIIRPLPDPFRFADGTRNTSFSSWERRRNEIKAAIEKYEIGPKPDCTDCTTTASYAPPPAGSNTDGVLTVVVTRNGKTLTLTSNVYIPQEAGSGPFPALITMTFRPRSSGPDTATLPASVITSRPIATIEFNHNQVTSLSFGHQGHSSDPFYQLYPNLCAGTCTGASNSGQYAAWSWGVSRLIDGIEIATRQASNPLPIDIRHLAVAGCSYAGKMALFAGAFDERIALTIAQENGGGGAPSWRVSHEIEADDSVEDIHDTSYDWFGGQMRQFAENNVYKLPEDHDELMAMVAPRALLETGNTDYYWLSNRSNYISARATQKIFNTFGIGDRFGFYVDGKHKHCSTLPAEAPAIAAFVDKFLLGKMSVDSDVEVNPYPNLDYSRWTAWWGGEPNHDPKFPDDWNTGGSVVMSLKRRLHLHVSSNQVVHGGYQLAISGKSHPAATVAASGASVQLDIRCSDGSSYTLTIPMPENQTYPIPANNRSFFPERGAFQGSTTAAQCNGVVEGAYFSALGVAKTRANPPAETGLTTTDMHDPLETRFACSAGGTAAASESPLTVNFQQ
ncbi:MAG TPA: hypothetical protein VGR47_16510 [Terracidiphilus sp.]|nr:hypothetical protein [Terracidiphilus sp.]